MSHNWFPDFHCVYTIIQVVHTTFIKVALTEYSACKSSRKMLQKQVAAAVIIALISKKNKSGKNRKKEESELNLHLKEQKIYEFSQLYQMLSLLLRDYSNLKHSNKCNGTAI